MNELQHFLAEIASGQRKKGECLTCSGTLLGRDNQPLSKGEVVFYTHTQYGSYTPTQLLVSEDLLPTLAASVQLSSEPAITVRNFGRCEVKAAPIHYNFYYSCSV
jgi:hypothetical protein